MNELGPTGAHGGAGAGAGAEPDTERRCCDQGHSEEGGDRRAGKTSRRGIGARVSGEEDRWAEPHAADFGSISCNNKEVASSQTSVRETRVFCYNQSTEGLAVLKHIFVKDY